MSFSCPKIEPEHLIHLLVNKEHSWDMLSSSYNNRQAKERTDWITNKKLPVQTQNYIEFVGSLRKILIDYTMKKTITKMDNNTGLKQKYSNFLQKSTFHDVILYHAFGSTNPTSDYDLTFAGPGIHVIVNCMFECYQKLKIGATMTYSFDTNFYLVPNLLLNRYNKPRLRGLKIKLFPVEKKNNFYVPVPDTPEIFDKEYRALKFKVSRSENLDNHKLVKHKYKLLLAQSTEMDEFLYQNIDNQEHNTAKWTKDIFWDKLIEMNKTSIEAYYCLSTILAVVYSIQAKREQELSPYMSADNWLIAAFENMIDLYKHQGHSFKPGKSEANKNLAIKVSKYIYRIYYCLNFYFIKQQKSPPALFKKHYQNATQMFLYRSGKLEKNQTPDVDQYVRTFALNKKLQFHVKHPVFDPLLRDLDDRASFLFSKPKNTKKSRRSLTTK